MAEFILAARQCGRKSPFFGEESLIDTQEWFRSTPNSSFSVPSKGRYPLKFYAESLGIDPPIWRPGVMAVVRKHRTLQIRQAPPAQADFIIALERSATSHDHPYFPRYYAAVFVLMAIASWRFCGARDVSLFLVTDTSVCGSPICQKSKNADATQWAAPKSGFLPDALLLAPLARIWRKVQH